MQLKIRYLTETDKADKVNNLSEFNVVPLHFFHSTVLVRCRQRTITVATCERQ